MPLIAISLWFNIQKVVGWKDGSSRNKRLEDHSDIRRNKQQKQLSSIYNNKIVRQNNETAVKAAATATTSAVYQQIDHMTM